MESNGEWRWIFGGTFALTFLSALFSFVNVGLPIPAYRVLDLLLPYSSVLVTPLAYWGSYGFLWHSKHFALATLLLAVLVGLLDGWWLVDGWADGREYRGVDALWASVSANFGGFGLVISLALFGFVRRAKTLASGA